MKLGKNTFVLLVLSLIVIITSAIPVHAQSGGGGTSMYFNDPVVPMDRVLRGRQSVADYVLPTLGRVDIYLEGTSVLGPAYYYALDSYSLTALGWKNHGIFSELSEAMANLSFNSLIVKSPDGYYDVSTRLVYWNTNGANIMNGWGWTPIQDNPDGSITACKFQPDVELENNIVIQTNSLIVRAVWIGRYGAEQNLQLAYENANLTSIQLPLKFLEYGYLILVDVAGNAVGWDLNTQGSPLSFKRLYTMLGGSQSSEFRVSKLPVIDSGGSYFYHDSWSGNTYGKFPLIELVIKTNMSTVVNFTVPFTNPNLGGLAPSRMFVTPYVMDSPVRGLTNGVETELPWVTLPTPGFNLNLPSGKYHVRTEFENLLSWDLLGGKG